MKYLIMCEGPNELGIIRILLEHDKLKFTQDDLLGLTSYHARQIDRSTVVKTELGMYHGNVEVLRVGDTLTDKLRIPKEYRNKITAVKKYCTKPELEMLLIISEQKESRFNRVSSCTKPKIFCKNEIKYNNKTYDNSTKFYQAYYGSRVNVLINAINRYKQIKRHSRDEYYLADLLK